MFFVAQQLLRGGHNVLITQICDIAYAVIIKPLILELDSLHHILLLAMYLDMLLADELKELAHLLNRWFFTLAIVLTAGAILIVLFLFCIEDMFDDGLHLRWQVFLRASELECVGAILLRYFLHFLCDTILIILGLGSLYLAFKCQC